MKPAVSTLLVVLLMLAGCGKKPGSVAEAKALAVGGFSGEVTVSGRFSSSRSVEAIADDTAAADGKVGWIHVDLSPLFNGMSEEQRKAVHDEMVAEYLGQRVTVKGVLKKARLEVIHMDTPLIEVTELAPAGDWSAARQDARMAPKVYRATAPR